MKWFKRIALFLLLVLLAAAGFAVGQARRTTNPVGFQVVPVDTPSGTVAVALWYPTTGRPLPTTFAGGHLLDVARDGDIRGERLPLVLMSHGNGGSALSHVDLAMELASAGYVVAAPTHAGDNYADASRQGSASLFAQRAGQMRSTADFVLSRWVNARHVDPGRLGAFGMSAGGFTVLTLAGGKPDMGRIAGHCRQSPEFVCKALAQAGSPLLGSGSDAGVFVPDVRIRAVVVAAPGLGFTFGHGSLDDVRVPVQVWTGDRDQTVPFESNARPILQGLGGKAEAHRLHGAGHLSFLAPCTLLRPSGPCTDLPGFDRAAAHAAMNREVIDFFDRHLGPPPAAEAR
ncbi:MAG: alpha/beta hydrolase family protein [Lysobacteraceae bacterium]